MKKVKGLTNRIVAMLMSGMLVVGAVPGTVLASENQADIGQSSEIAAEVPEGADTEEVSAEVYSENAGLQQEEAAGQYYTVILDANGGFFENEWDDSIGEIVEQAQVVNKQIPVGGTVAAAPVFAEMDQAGNGVTFAGWSLEPDGDLVTVGDEEYAPVDSCTLYAVWKAEDPSAGDVRSDIESQESAEENTDQIDASQDSVELDEAAEGSQDVQNSVESEAAEGSQDLQNSVEAEEADETEGLATNRDAWDNETAEESSTDENPASETDTYPETVDENEQAVASDQETVYTGEDAEKASEEASEAAAAEEETQPELIGSSEEEETVSEDAENGIVKSGTCGDNLTWTLDSGTLTISGTGTMRNYAYSPWRDYSVNEVIIKNGASSIGNGAFCDCSLTSVTIPDSVTSIGDDAFFDCPNLASVTIPSSVTSMGRNVFRECSSLTRVTISGSVTSIGYYAFYECSSLISATIPDSVTSIGEYAFCRCSNMTSVMIPGGVTSIGRGAFSLCSSLTGIDVVSDNSCYASADGVLFNKNKTILIQYPNGKSESSYTIPDSVTSISDYAFYECSSLISVPIPDSVNSIGNRAFYECSSLTSVTIPDGVTTISNYVFYDCKNLTNVSIPDSVTSIGEGSFQYCKRLSNVLIPDSVKSIDGFAFYSCDSLTSISIPNGVTTIYDSTFRYCDSLRSVSIPLSVTQITPGAFSNCPNLIVYTANEYVIEYCRNNGIEVQRDYFIIGRDSNSFGHTSDLFGIGKKLEGRIGTSYTTSLYNYSKLCDGLKGSQQIELLDRMNGEWEGSCEGLAISMGMSFLKKIDINGFEGSNGSSPTCYSDLKAPYANLNFRDLINYYQLLQTVDKHNNPKGWLFNLTDGMHFLDGRWTLSTYIEGTTNFWQGFAKYVKEADAKATPLLFSMSFTVNHVPEGHTLLTCGYKETNRYYIIKLYDCNQYGQDDYDYLYLFIDKLNYDEFKFSTTDDTITEYTLFNDWNYFEFFGENDWEELDSSIQYVKRSSGATSKNNTNSDSNNAFLYFTISAGKEFRLENGSGQYLQFKNERLSNTLDIYEFEALNDGSEYRFKVLNSEDLILTEFEDETKFCFRTDYNYASVSTQNADEIRVQNNSTITIAGDVFSYTLRMSTNSDNSMVELSGKSKDEAIIAHDGNEVSISSHNSDNLGVTVYDVQGNISKDSLPASDTIVINENELVIHSTPLEPETTEVIVPYQTYTGKKQEPVPSVTVNGNTLTLDKDYTVSYKNNINAGTASVIITGIGDYTGTITKTFTIEKAAQSITADDLSLTLPGTGIIFVSGNQGNLTFVSDNTDVAEVDASGNVTAKGVGTANITITAEATDNYMEATKTITVTVAGSAYYAVTMDANGGVIINETDDDAGREVTNAETVTKYIAEDRYAFIPSRHVQNEDTSLFLTGWALSPDGAPVVGFNESFKPDSDCTLYAVWKHGKPAGTMRYGDLNYNGILDGGDGIKIQRHNKAYNDTSVRAKHPDWIMAGYEYEAADINHDTVINGADYMLLIRDIAARNNEETQAGHPDWIISETFTTYSFDEIEPRLVTGITLNNSKIVLEKGKSATLTADLVPKDADDTSIAWSSSNAEVVTVDVNGSVKGVSEGTATITAAACDGSGVYAACEVTVTAPIKSIEEASVTGITSKAYTGNAITQELVVKIGDTILEKDIDYTIAYSNNINAGTATVTITGKGNYTGTVSKNFTINKAAQSITAKAVTSPIAVGKATIVSVTGAKGTKSFKSSDTTIATVDSKTGKVTARKVGTVKITATSAATANYNAASKTVTIKVVPAAVSSYTAANLATGIKLTWKKVTGANGYKVYRGKTLIKTVKNGAALTCTDTKANSNGAKYTFMIVPKSAYGDGAAKIITIYRVAGIVTFSVKNNASKRMTVRWNRNARASGYQILYSRNKSFSSGNKAVNVTNAATVSKVIGSLTKGRTYYVKIRSFKKVGGTRYWSVWSSARSVKISK